MGKGKKSYQFAKNIDDRPPRFKDLNFYELVDRYKFPGMERTTGAYRYVVSELYGEDEARLALNKARIRALEEGRKTNIVGRSLYVSTRTDLK